MLTYAITTAVLLIPAEYHIDFTGWHGAAAAEFDVRITAMDGTEFETTVLLAPGATVIQAHNLVWFALKRNGWRGYTVGKGVLVLQGSKKAPIRSVKFTSMDWKPDVRVVLNPPEKK